MASPAPAAAAFTVARGPHALDAARLLRATFEAAHPDIPFFLVGDEAYAFFARQTEVAHVGEIVSLRAMIGWFLSLHFPRVIYLDADVLVLDRLEALLDWPAPAEAALTHDVAAFDYGIEAPRVNAGVLAASSPRFWKTWMHAIYAFLVPVGPNFFDQVALRLLAQNGVVPVRLLPEKEERDFYNISHVDVAGAWRAEEGPGGPRLLKGDARVRLWHWAGSSSKTSLDALPEPARRVALARLERGWERAESGRGEQALRRLLDQAGPAFLRLVEGQFAAMETSPIDGFVFRDRTPPPGLYASDAPAAWEAWRRPTPGLHRRLLPNAPRYVYARDPERLREPDVDALDAPLVLG